LAKLQRAGDRLRYFNVYGPREAHKGRMARSRSITSIISRDGKVRLFEGSHGYPNGEQRRDFIHVDDVVAGNLHFCEKPKSGIYNSAQDARRASMRSR